MTRRRKPSFDPETIDPASVVKFQTIRRLGRTFEVDLSTPVPIAHAIEIGSDIAMLRARHVGLPEAQAVRLAQRIAEFLSEEIEWRVQNFEADKLTADAYQFPDRETNQDDDMPF